MGSIVTTTPARAIKLPSSGTAAAAGGRFVANQPWDAGVAQLCAVNAACLARENACGPLAWHPGWPALYQGLRVANDATSFAWDVTDGNGGASWCAGRFLLTRWDGHRYPRLVLRFTWKTAATTTAGVVMVVMPGLRHPDFTYAVSKVTTSTTFVADHLDFPGDTTGLPPGAVHQVPLTISPGSATPRPTPPELGTADEVAVYVGFWGSNDKLKTTEVAGVVLALEPPT